MKSFKMPKVYSETVNQRTDNTMAKRKIDQRQTKVHRSHYRKVKIEQLEPTQNLG
jgi:hypothetical protein